jgi:RHS repeat-associated protein
MPSPQTPRTAKSTVSSEFGYYPFGMMQEGRQFVGGMGYRWGFGSQEADNEVSGRGNSYTAEFWQYDSRLGRRWDVDPVVKADRSPYSTLGNNPATLIDPNGLTDIYNVKGRWIGTDGIDNGQRKMATSKSTAKKVKKLSKGGFNVSLNYRSEEYKTLVQIPSTEVLTKIKLSWDNTNTDNSNNSVEHGFAVGKDDNGKDITSAIYKEEDNEDAVDLIPAMNEILAKGDLTYTVHTHTVKFEVSSNGFLSSSYYPSRQDIDAVTKMSNAAIDGYEPYGFQEIAIGPSWFGSNNNGKMSYTNKPYISFYDSRSQNVKDANKEDSRKDAMEPNVSLPLNRYLRAANRANAHVVKSKCK